MIVYNNQNQLANDFGDEMNYSKMAMFIKLHSTKIMKPMNTQ